ncbi:MAG: hypothetical protein ACP5XB_15345 [Isosphaeraceae bacterium]
MVPLLILAAVLGHEPADRMQQIDFLRLSYKANKDAFAYGTFRFEYTKGSCASVSDAEAGVFTRSFKENGLLIFDGQNFRYELVPRPEVLAAATRRVGDHGISRYIMAFRMVTDGKATLHDRLSPDETKTALNHIVWIDPGTELLRSDFLFPLYLGDDSPRAADPFTELTEFKNGKVSLAELDFDSRLDGRKVCKFSVTWSNGKISFWIDATRGYVPLRILDHYNAEKIDNLYEFSDVEEVPGGGWIPRRMLFTWHEGAYTERIVITEIDAQHRPPQSAFRLDFPKPVTVHDRVKRVIHPRMKSWSLLRPPTATSPGARPAIPPNYVAPADLPGEIDAGLPWGIIAAVGVLLLLPVAGIVILERRRRAPGA